VRKLFEASLVSEVGVVFRSGQKFDHTVFLGARGSDIQSQRVACAVGVEKSFAARGRKFRNPLYSIE
jgi:hypothetical protein